MFYNNDLISDIDLILVTTNSSTIRLNNGEVKLISSPRWPRSYYGRDVRTFTIYSPENTSVKLAVLDLVIERHCNFDTIRIYDGEYIFCMCFIKPNEKLSEKDYLF